ncbi:MAG: class I SAM-dependent methyltransferase, partial [Planctomycetota bacterium]
MTNRNSLEGRLLAATAAVMLFSGFGPLLTGRAHAAEEGLAPSIRAMDLFAMKDRCGGADPVKESLQLTGRHAFGGPEFKAKKILAFEENRYFIYAVGVASDADGDGGAGDRAKGPPRLLRRFILLKPSTMVVDDLVRGPARGQSVRWFLRADSLPEIAGRRFRILGAKGELIWESLLPEKVTLKTIRREEGGKQPEANGVEIVPHRRSEQLRFLHVIHARNRGDQGPEALSELVQKDGRLRLTVTPAGRVFRLFLRPRSGADEIEVTGADGKVLLARRLLPAGVLPHGPEGTKLLERWDSAYRGDRRPGWDIGRPSSEVKKAVEEGTLKPCRAVVLGCGSGTNAVFLASKGFDVTGIDIAPTALSRAREKARKADVKVRFLLADVLAPPELRPFELIYDRGCYHGVRRQNATGYVKTVCRLTKPGS